METNSRISGASKGGLVGGKISRKPRYIKIGDQLTSEEMLFMAKGVGDILRDSGCKPNEAMKRMQINSDLLVEGKWDKVFTQTLENSVYSLAEWRRYFISSWAVMYKKLTDNDMSEEDESKLRALKNMSRAYDVTLNTKTKWVKEAKNLIK